MYSIYELSEQPSHCSRSSQPSRECSLLIFSAQELLQSSPWKGFPSRKIQKLTKWAQTEIIWWLISCVNLTGLRDVQIVGKPLFLGMSMRMFPDKINIWIGGLKKAYGHLQSGWALSNLLRTWIKQRGEERGSSHSVCLTARAETSVFSCPGAEIYAIDLPSNRILKFGPELMPLVPLVLNPSDSDWNHNTSFSGSLAFRQQTVGILSLHMA